MAINSHRSKKAFTLVEVLLASTLAAIVAAAGLATYRSVSESRQILGYTSEVNAHARYALNMIRTDLANMYRGTLPDEMRLKGITAERDGRNLDRLILYVISNEKVALSDNPAPQGDIFEVEYGLSPSPQKSQLFLGRRLAPVEDLETGNPKGNLTRIARYIDQLTFEFYDYPSARWHRGWEYYDQLPQRLRVTMVLTDPKGKRPPMTVSQEIALPPLPPEPSENTQDQDTNPQDPQTR